jgi:glycosyltransferase involved in cell wall biosynthesis
MDAKTEANSLKISVVTGTLNRRAALPGLMANTVDAHTGLELVLVDGGSTDGTIEYITQLDHPRVRFVQVGRRSSYPHFMNLGIRNSTCEFVCQWNDDVILTNSWEQVLRELDESEVYIFAWRKQRRFALWPKWTLINTVQPDGSGQIVMNYGVYHRDVFRRIGLYCNDYEFYCADGDMSYRAWAFGCKVKCLPGIRVLSMRGIKKTRSYDTSGDIARYEQHRAMYHRHELPAGIEYLQR